MCSALRGTADDSHARGRPAPRLTVALPLYRSARFLPVIEANLDALAALPDVEVLISDRHGLDDTIERLRARHGADARFHFFAATDGIDWVAHFNALLARGRGTYFAWMPHDDTFPVGYYATLAAHLDERADTLLAFGPLIGDDEHLGEPAWTASLRHAPPWSDGGRWATRNAYRMLAHHPWVPFRGVFRREPIVRAGLALVPTHCNEGADVGWLFGVGLLGAIRFVPAAPACLKRYHRKSAHVTTMPFTLRSQSSVYRVFAQHAFRFERSKPAAVVGLFRLARVYTGSVIFSHLGKLADLRARYQQARRWIKR